MVDRIKQLLDWQQLSPTQFADRIGVGRPVVSHILSERNKPSLEVVRSIKAAFPELSFDWLLNGSGEMLVAALLAPATVIESADAPPAAAPAAPPPTKPDPTAPVALPPPTPGAEATRPVNAATESPGPYQRAASGPGPARFQPADAASAAAVEPGATRFVADKGQPAPVAPARATFNAPPPTPIAPLLAAPPALPVLPMSPIPAAAAQAPGAASLPPAATTADAAVLAQVLGESLGAPGKTIRRIVLFYTDGSFADYKPE